MTGVEVLIGCDPGPADPAAARLRASFAERHVPLPVPLAEALARMLASRQPLLEPVWGRAFTCMSRALGISGAVAGQQLMKGVLDRFLLVVAEPVMRFATERARIAPLAGRAPLADATIRWTGAEAAIAREADAALRDAAVMGLPFWAHAALDLSGAAHQKAWARARRAEETSAPECDPMLAALVFLHPPKFEALLGRQQIRRKARQTSAKRRAGIRPKEGGVAGILQSRMFDDLPDALMSELILPRALLANKLLHEGLLVRHRPPRRDPNRDLLAVTLHRAAPGDAMGTLVKAAWADATIRLRVALLQMGLTNSDLVWGEPGATQSLDCALDLPGIDRLPPLMIEGKARADMLMRSGLYPAHAILPRHQPKPEPEVEMDGADNGLISGLRAALSPLAVAQKRSSSGIAKDYGRRFMLISRPHRGRNPPEWATLRAEHVSQLDREFGRAHQACLCWLGGTAMVAPVLLAMADGREPIELTVPAADAPERDDLLAEFMGELVLWMMDVTLEALDVR